MDTIRAVPMNLLDLITVHIIIIIINIFRRYIIHHVAQRI